MTTTPATTRVHRPRVALALARLEARRMLRHPLLPMGALLSTAFAWTAMRGVQEWHGAQYGAAPLVLAPVFLAVSLVVAQAFRREHRSLTDDVPSDESVRAAGRFLGALPLVALVAVVAGAGAAYVRDRGGFDLGDQPGRTLHAQFSLGEVLQQPVLAIVAVALGAAAGRRLRHPLGAAVPLFLLWFLSMSGYWMFQGRHVVPFSLIQVQPVQVPIGRGSTDPTTYPADWLLAAPDDYLDHWDRLFVSGTLAAWHNIYLLGMAALLIGVALPRRTRPVALLLGVVLMAVGAAMQYAVLPASVT